MIRRLLVAVLATTLIVGLSVGVFAKKPDKETKVTGPPEIIIELKLELDAAKAAEKIDRTIETSKDEIENAMTLAEMLERADHNDKKIAQIISNFEKKYGSIGSSPYYIEVYNAFVDESVWIDPIHICGSAGS